MFLKIYIFIGGLLVGALVGGTVMFKLQASRGGYYVTETSASATDAAPATLSRYKAANQAISMFLNNKNIDSDAFRVFYVPDAGSECTILEVGTSKQLSNRKDIQRAVSDKSPL